MTYKRHAVVMAFATVAYGMPVNVGAQNVHAGQVEVLAAGGLHKLWDDESSIGTGIVGGAGLGIDFGNGVIFEASGTRYAAELLWQPSASKHSPYFGVGAGGFTYTRTSHYPAEPSLPGRTPRPAETFTRSGTDTMLGGLAGFSAVATERFRFGPEASLWWSRPGYFIAIEVGVVASVRF